MMDKPTKIPRDPIYNYHEVIRYIEKKYKIKTRRYKNDNLDFWHWLLDKCFDNVNNGSEHSIDIRYWLDHLDEDAWQREILQLIYDEFGEDDMEFWIEW